LIQAASKCRQNIICAVRQAKYTVCACLRGDIDHLRIVQPTEKLLHFANQVSRIANYDGRTSITGRVHDVVKNRCSAAEQVKASISKRQNWHEHCAVGWDRSESNDMFRVSFIGGTVLP
jgi:hypothetical protein